MDMIVYTVKTEDGKLYPKAILSFQSIKEAVVDGKIVLKDYGIEEIEEFCKKKNKPGCDILYLAKCEIKEI